MATSTGGTGTIRIAPSGMPGTRVPRRKGCPICSMNSAVSVSPVFSVSRPSRTVTLTFPLSSA